jgi:hypothetical protein
MARSNKLTKASVFEDTRTQRGLVEAMSKTRQVNLQWISQGTIIHSCKHIAIRFGNVKPL